MKLRDRKRLFWALICSLIDLQIEKKYKSNVLTEENNGFYKNLGHKLFLVCLNTSFFRRHFSNAKYCDMARRKKRLVLLSVSLAKVNKPNKYILISYKHKLIP